MDPSLLRGHDAYAFPARACDGAAESRPVSARLPRPTGYTGTGQNRRRALRCGKAYIRMGTVHNSSAAGCRRGDVVRGRSREEILAPLDADGAAGDLPFMPEMLAYCGRELPVYARADKTCDTIEMTGTKRRMSATVHLTGARCDGSAHGGCQ